MVKTRIQLDVGGVAEKDNLMCDSYSKGKVAPAFNYVLRLE
jgi:hypothetical protein